MGAAGDVEIRDLAAADVPAAIDVLVAAFLGFPLLELITGSDDGAARRLRQLYQMEFEADSKVSTLVAEHDGRVVGVLMHADSPDCVSGSLGRSLRFLRIAGRRLFASVRLLARLDGVHPGTPHRHLPTLGVRPEFQGQGIGGHLMDRYNSGCDRAGLPGYLETIRWSRPDQPSHERFYQRAGFSIRDELPADEAWSILTMWRTPATVLSRSDR